MIRSSLHFLTGTLVSRLAGFVRDVLMAFYFGTFAETAAFFIAYRMANLFRRVFAEGALLNGFVPFYEKFSMESSQKGFFFFRDLSFSLFVFLFLFIGFLEGVFFLISPYCTVSMQYIFLLIEIMLPSLIFICLFGLFSSYLQCKGRFFTSGVIPFIFNIVWIASILLSRNRPIKSALIYVSLGILIAFIIQWLAVLLSSISSLKTEGELSSFIKPELFPSIVKKMIKPFFASVIGVSATQINSGLDVIFARIASLEGPAYLSYAIRIEQLPIAFFGISVASALLPLLSKQFEQGLKLESLLTVQETLRKILIILFFCTFGLFALGFVGLNVVYARGGFNALSLHYTLRSLWMYSVGLIPTALVIILAPIFYAQKDFRTPMKSSLLAVGSNILMNSLFIFIFHTNAEGIALATSISSWINCLYLIVKLHYKDFPVIDPRLYKMASKGLLTGFSSFFLTQLIAYHYYLDTSWFSLLQKIDQIKIISQFTSQIGSFFILSSFYCGLYFIIGGILGLFRYEEAFQWIKTKKILKNIKIKN